MIILHCEQGSDTWLAVRAGIPTSSNFDRIITTQGLPSKQRQKYMYRLAGERLTGMPMENYLDGNMERGKELEAEARATYELVTGNTVEQVGFCMGDTRSFGASPDGLVGDKGGVELKCPILSTAVEYLDKRVLPTIYLQQTQGTLLVTGRAWWDFVSYHPGLPFLVVRVERDEKFINTLRKELGIFCAELTELTERIRGGDDKRRSDSKIKENIRQQR